MANKLDSTSLFLSQVNQHAEALGGLLSGVVEDSIDDGLIERCIVGTRMLAKSAALMELTEWQATLEAFQSLLETYRKKKLPWDERIAEITSGIIEKEDMLVAGSLEGGLSNLDGAVSTEELQALSCEVRELLKYAVESRDERVRAGSSPSQKSAPSSRSTETTPATQSGASGVEAREPISDVRALEGSMAELRRHTGELFEAWDTSWRSRAHQSSTVLDDVRRELLVVGFYASSIERIVAGGMKLEGSPMIESLAPVGVAVHDFARVSGGAAGRNVELTLTGEKHAIDARLILPVYRVLQRLVGDVLLRCGEKNLLLDIDVEEKYGALYWALRDNGENFVSDSHFDRDEYLAFYPGLREVRRVLGELHSLLWVEPNGSHGTRFAFTTPVSLEDDSFMVWGDDCGGIAAYTSQLAGIHRTEDVRLSNDSHGERVTSDGRQVRVLRLGQIYPEGPTDGDFIAIIGSLEKRIAFYVEGNGRVEKGVWRKDGTAAGRIPEFGTVQFGDTQVALAEANGLLKKYMSIVDVVSEEDVSGGVDEVVSNPSLTQAKREKETKAPPEKSASRKRVDVLVVEQSESIRESLGSILSDKGLSAAAVEGLDAAMEFLDSGRASVIISDFRVPTMAAKVVAERLRREGRNIPVFVTTSHRGKNAEVLVKRLGVAGYIGKPLNAEEVLSRVREHAGPRNR
jgi:CheY-like chemotaxis protein